MPVRVLLAKLPSASSLSGCTDATLSPSQVALLEPLAAQLGLELSVSVFACTDEKFMGLFTGVCGTQHDFCVFQCEAS